ncbi:MAG: undecaprenyldiphospho-muramoylpentapeptide beta-N-acetylglucosaminyltransferase [Bacteroidetes bacterium]|nr:undecaprenyldiphospho-muramoylpentapeptide beta-N-acetylglucosaminyltransferase [Bacteroidota bacterium]MBU2584930.1 undecaprenyldiphospho-muramoylpentapeptide beta-N-acetylglucosaminyltransferase [Bacteroidota bacterium]
MNKKSTYRFLFACGGTGGHIFPAVAIAEELKKFEPQSRILFVGTKHRMESKVIPNLGYEYKAISIKGMPRKIGFEVISFTWSLILSLLQSISIIAKFKPHVSLGTGSYISVAPLFISKVFNRPVILSESNSFPGIATKVLAPIANQVHLGYESSLKYFKSSNRIFVTGNPIRNILQSRDRDKAAEYFNLNPNIKTILIVGGSLGARSINQKLSEIIERLSSKYQIIWQTGVNYLNEFKSLVSSQIRILPFIDRMDYAYAMSDLFISRAGASTIAEITNQGLVSILIPSPNVTENHQYHNAMTLVEKYAAEILLDNESSEALLNKIESILTDNEKLREMSFNAKQLSKPNAAKIIAEESIKISKVK